jgi:hypothetical protein
MFRAALPEYRRHESYRFLALGWDIVRALYLIEKRPRDPQSIDVETFAKNYGFPFHPEGTVTEDTPLEHSGFFYVDVQTVMSDQIDLARPLLIALMMLEGREQPGAILIDGLNRLFKAARLGVAEITAYVLTSEEEQLCRI